MTTERWMGKGSPVPSARWARNPEKCLVSSNIYFRFKWYNPTLTKSKMWSGAGCGCLRPGLSAVGLWLPDSQDVSVPSGLSLPGILFYVASSRHFPRFALLLSCSLSSCSLTCWGCLLEMGSRSCGWYQHGRVRAGEGTSRVGGS